MISISFNFQLHRFRYFFKFGKISICSSSTKYFSSSQFSFQTLSSHNRLCKNSNYKSFRYIYTTDNKFRKLPEVLSSENNKKENSIIYNGALTYQVKGVKVFTCITSLGGIIIQPLIVQNILNGNNMPLGVAVFCCVGFFTFLTPFIIHMITKKYVTEIWYNSATDTYTATMLSFFLQKINISFKIEDVTVPSMLPIFSTMNIKGRPVFIVSDSFLEMEHYIKMMGYDKPIDMKVSAVSDSLKKSPNEAKSETLGSSFD